MHTFLIASSKVFLTVGPSHLFTLITSPADPPDADPLLCPLWQKNNNLHLLHQYQKILIFSTINYFAVVWWLLPFVNIFCYGMKHADKLVIHGKCRGRKREGGGKQGQSEKKQARYFPKPMHRGTITMQTMNTWVACLLQTSQIKTEGNNYLPKLEQKSNSGQVREEKTGIPGIEDVIAVEWKLRYRTSNILEKLNNGQVFHRQKSTNSTAHGKSVMLKTSFPSITV